jgi:hypothetical protein
MTQAPHLQAVRRKRGYLALILVLFAANTFLWRGVAWFDRPALPWTVTAQADRLGLRERDLGEVELTGSAVRLTLTGSRGLVVCSLWVAAEEKKKKHEWNQLELIVDSLIKLQPFFSSIWLFQSHNLAYNVSVELEEGRDQYHFIARGIQLLAEGSRRLRDDPDLRSMMGFYYLNKLGLSDDKNLLQALFQLSCIDPRERDPARFLRADGQVDPTYFEQFCREHPRLVRRLREQLDCQTPDDVVRFLRDNATVPTRFRDPAAGGASRLKPVAEQFPVLPPAWPGGAGEPTPDDRLDDDFDNYLAARAWYTYAQEPLPPPSPTPAGRLTDFDRTRYRLPRLGRVLLFRDSPAKAQWYRAERLQRDGWIDADGWDVDEGQDARWFPGRRVVLGAGRGWAADAWDLAYTMWRRHGRDNGLLLDPVELAALEADAAPYRAAYRVAPDQEGPDLDGDDVRALERSREAHRQLYWYQQNRQLTNFAHFYHTAEVYRTPPALEARKHFYRAEQLRQRGEPAAALRAYDAGLQRWAPLLVQHRDFSRDRIVQEEAVELQDRFRALFREVRSGEVKQLLVVGDFLTQALAGAGPYLPPVHLLPARTAPVPITAGPLDNLTDAWGEPIITAEALRVARQR